MEGKQDASKDLRNESVADTTDLTFRERKREIEREREGGTKMAQGAGRGVKRRHKVCPGCWEERSVEPSKLARRTL